MFDSTVRSASHEHKTHLIAITHVSSVSHVGMIDLQSVCFVAVECAESAEMMGPVTGSNSIKNVDCWPNMVSANIMGEASVHFLDSPSLTLTELGCELWSAMNEEI